MIEFNQLFELSIQLFLIGLFGILACPANIIIIMISIELLLLAASFSFIIFSIYFDDIIGQIFAILILLQQELSRLLFGLSTRFL